MVSSMVIPRLRSPIVLVHGLLGFDRVKFCGWTVACYFPGIDTAFAEAGNRVLVAQLSPSSSIKQRATELKAFLDRESPHDPVHIIGHSMGGLDSRHMISRLDMSERVLSLTTIGTPHRGTAFADWGVRRLAPYVQPILDLLHIPYEAIFDLTTTRCRKFNEETPDAQKVRYFSVAGRFEPNWMYPEWQIPHRIIRRKEGPNDGLVSETSATYGEDCAKWEGDHVSLINWPAPAAKARGVWRDRVDDYGSLVRRLADEGY
jgi:triacylglycerol lipase